MGRGWVSVLVGLTLVLAGCSGSTSDQPKVLPPVVTPSASPSTAPTASAGPVVVPSAAVPATPQGAAAFVRFYFERLNEAFRRADPELTRELVDPACRTCANFNSAVRRVRDAGNHIDGQAFSVVTVEAAPPDQGSVVVDVFLDFPRTHEVTASGTRTNTSVAQPRHHYSVFLARNAARWRVRAIQDSP